MSPSLSDRFFKRGREFLGVEYPILCGAMTWVSDPTLIGAVSDAGGFACLAGGNTPVELLQEQIHETREKTDKPFGVNLITIAPAYRDHVQLAIDMELPHVIFAGSFPRRGEVEGIKGYGGKVTCFASTNSIARRMLEYGADALILEGMEAGGHVGHVTLSILLQQVLFETRKVPVFVAGGIASGRFCAHLMLMGACGVQLGTRFAMSKECNAHPDFKKVYMRAKARDAISTPQYDSRLPVVAVRALKNDGMKDFGKLQLELLARLDSGELHRNDAQMEVERYWIGRLRDAVVDGDVDKGSLMAGQSVGLVNDIKSVKEIIDEIVGDIAAELERVRGALA